MKINTRHPKITSTNLLFLEASFFNTVGFVLAQDTITQEYKCYTYKLGGDRSDYDFTPQQDVDKILAHGSTFPLEAAEHIFSIDMKTSFIDTHPEIFL